MNRQSEEELKGEDSYSNHFLWVEFKVHDDVQLMLGFILLFLLLW